MEDSDGLRVLLTGGNSIGREAVRGLAEHGAHVLLACRDLDKGRRAAGDIGSEAGEIDLLQLDPADLDAVRACAEEAASRMDRLDVLVNDAGVMATPRRTTADGFELQHSCSASPPAR